MKILALRHGEPLEPNISEILETGKVPDLGLSLNGIIQVTAQIPILGKAKIVGSYVTPKKRGIQTIAKIAKVLQLGYWRYENLRSVDVEEGELRNIINEIQKGEKQWWKLWLEGFPGFEKPENFVSRIKNVMDEIISLHTSNDTILIIAHEEVIKAFHHIFNGTSFKEAVQTIDVPHASITEFQI